MLARSLAPIPGHPPLGPGLPGASVEDPLLEVANLASKPHAVKTLGRGKRLMLVGETEVGGRQAGRQGDSLLRFVPISTKLADNPATHGILGLDPLPAQHPVVEINGLSQETSSPPYLRSLKKKGESQAVRPLVWQLTSIDRTNPGAISVSPSCFGGNIKKEWGGTGKALESSLPSQPQPQPPSLQERRRERRAGRVCNKRIPFGRSFWPGAPSPALRRT